MIGNRLDSETCFSGTDRAIKARGSNGNESKTENGREDVDICVYIKEGIVKTREDGVERASGRGRFL